MGDYPAYPAYTDSGIPWIGETPAHWVVKPLKRVAMVQPSNVDKKTEDDELPVLLCNYTDVYNNEGITSEIDFMQATATPQEIEKFRIVKGDVIVTKDSESPHDIAVPAYVAEDFENTLCGYHLTQIRPADLDGKFLFRLFQSTRFNAQFVVGANGVTRFGLPQRVINDAPVAFPPLDEQQAIARFLDHKTAQIDALIAKKEALLAKLAEKRSALITHAVTQGLDPTAPMRDSGIEWLGEIPAHWEVIKFRYCCSIAEGQVDPQDESHRDRILIAPNHIESGTGRILYTESANDQAAISGKYLVKPGDVIYSKIRPELNKACIATDDWLCSADMYPISVARNLISSFLLFLLLSEPVRKLMVDESMRVAMPKVNRETLAGIPLVCPPENEQLRIDKQLKKEIATIDRMSVTVADAIAKLREYRAALITHAVTGKIDVRGVSLPALPDRS